MQTVILKGSEIKLILSKQIVLLSELSEKHKDEPQVIVELTKAMNELAAVWFDIPATL